MLEIYHRTVQRQPPLGASFGIDSVPTAEWSPLSLPPAPVTKWPRLACVSGVWVVGGMLVLLRPLHTQTPGLWAAHPSSPRTGCGIVFSGSQTFLSEPYVLEGLR